MPLSPNPRIESLQTCLHGGPDYAELESMGISPEDVVDFSVGSNPFGIPDGMRDTLSTVSIDRYPDSEATELRRCLAEKLGILPENIVAGNGAVEIIRLIALAYFGPEDPVLIVEPTFGEYEVACRIAGSRVVKQMMKADEGFRLDVEETIDLIHRYHPRGVFICNPNNPTGHYLARSEVEQVLDACQDSLLVLDEAYIAFVDQAWSSLDMVQGNNLIVLRSMTKEYALAGLRLGYAIAHQEVIGAIRKVCPPWNVNAMAQRAGVLALDKAGLPMHSKASLRAAKEFLVTELSQMGLPPLPSRANFFLVKVGNARRFRHNLLLRGFLVRDCSSFGLPEYVRIALRTMPECQRLIAAIKNITHPSTESCNNELPGAIDG